MKIFIVIIPLYTSILLNHDDIKKGGMFVQSIVRINFNKQLDCQNIPLTVIPKYCFRYEHLSLIIHNNGTIPMDVTTSFNISDGPSLSYSETYH